MAVDPLWEWQREVEIGGVFAVQFYRGLFRRSGTEPHGRPRESGTRPDVQPVNYEQANTPMKNTLYLGLDVHKDSITIAIAMGGAQWGSAPLWCDQQRPARA
jgi:hypothetical protein